MPECECQAAAGTQRRGASEGRRQLTPALLAAAPYTHCPQLLLLPSQLPGHVLLLLLVAVPALCVALLVLGLVTGLQALRSRGATRSSRRVSLSSCSRT